MPSTPIFHRIVSTPLGDMLIAGGSAGLRGVWFTDQRHLPAPSVMAAWHAGDHAVLKTAESALTAYWAGQPLESPWVLDWAQGTDFQRAVWRVLLGIPHGQTRRYGELAAQLGRPQAVRAVGSAVGRNPWSVLVPCHRVLGSGGALTGYAGGLPRKMALLDLEQKH
jgi:methylated-DNA-[protein]-cysteine S-methyltransferase